MAKWEYVYALAYNDLISNVNGKPAGEYKGFFRGTTGEPTVTEFLEKHGQEGWEVVGVCPASEAGHHWRLILKRPII